MHIQKKPRVGRDDKFFPITHFRNLAYKGRTCCSKCNSKANITRDHIFPESQGGIDYGLNIDFLCFPCNLSKKDDLPSKETIKELLDKTYDSLRLVEDAMEEEFDEYKTFLLNYYRDNNIKVTREIYKNRLKKLNSRVAMHFRIRVKHFEQFIKLLKRHLSTN